MGGTPQGDMRVPTTFPRLMLEHAKARPTAPALREKVYGIW
jgi:long-chain acyl-CoA synthetase